ncbi:MAG TPA: nucleoside triphosphate pyrophosphohydrolase [Candidatus Methylomirabilis sp.]|nr:nucleoside triphosphate pyrophosphohydrolase [Candidatus Methylomirabilis sp.]
MANSAGDRFDFLLGVMARLRADGGCPWDREQTRETLKPYLIEEAYEVLDAIDNGSTDHLVEELGDLLFQVVFHCQVAGERGEFTMLEVLERLTDKMIRRHPHVFGDRPVADAREALAQWERIKHDEGQGDGRSRSALDGVPATLPALLRAQRLQVKAGRVGFDWTDWSQAWAKLREEIGELEAALDARETARVSDEFGDVLFSMVNVARLRGIDAEDCLRQAAAKFTRRFREVEAEMSAAGRSVSETPAEDLDRAWETVKAREQGDSRGSGANR